MVKFCKELSYWASTMDVNLLKTVYKKQEKNVKRNKRS